MSYNKAIFVHGAHKSGTEFMRLFFKKVSDLAHIKGYSYNGFYKEPHNTADKITRDIQHSFCYCPIRTLNFEDNDNVEIWNSYQTEPKVKSGFTHIKDSNVFHIVQLRDVRDILISRYFSFGWSHLNPENSEEHLKYTQEQRTNIQKSTIDDYVLSCINNDAGFIATLEAMQTLDRPDLNITVLKYEDMVLDFEVWATKAIQVFDFSDEDDIVKRLVRLYKDEFKPFPEDPTKHKRKMIPGDYKEKLKPETIAILNKKLQWQTKYGYDMT